ncbi:unnamed protein product [Brachionus calyciflorus]|uniref:Uncharacterized protein n=1 Tax=Brachionus calyciflorus TaxID=104777 RepID=A0A813T5S5_9BILA|nr:unnamed protein product [Brachionus calyciflorus]
MKNAVRFIKNNDLISLQNYIKSLPNDQKAKLMNDTYFDEDFYDQSNLLLTACLIANNRQIIEYLVKECQVDIESLISLKNTEDWDSLTFHTSYSNYEYKACFNLSGTILWHLCRIKEPDYFDAIKLLVSLGANVNTQTECQFKSTPLMAACSKCNFKLVKFLIEEAKANYKILDLNGENCLYYAIRRHEDSLDLVKYLIGRGLGINHKNRLGRSVLNLSVELKKSDTFKFIMSLKPDIPNYLSLNCPLITTALNGDWEKFNILFESYKFDPIISIFGLEILGARLAEDVENFHLALYYWELSLDHRKASKQLKDPIQIEGFIPEFNSNNELNRIAKNSIELILQNLLIRERVLLKFNQPCSLAKFDLYQNLRIDNQKINFDTFFANNYDRIQYLWNITLSLQIKYLKPLDESIITNLTNYSLYLNYLKTNRNLTKYKLKLSHDFIFKALKINLHEIIRVAKCTLDSKTLFRENFELKYPNFEDIFAFNDERLVKKNLNYDSCYSNDSFLIFTYLELLKVISVFLIRILLSFKINDQEEKDLKLIVYNLVTFDKFFKGEQSILALCLKPNLLKDYGFRTCFKTYDPVSLKCVEYFLMCGADPNSKEFLNRMSKNNCLNSCMVNRDLMRNKCLVEDLIKLFLKYGAHLDFKNDFNQSFVDKYENKYQCLFLDKYKHISLKCLCAAKLKFSKILYKNELPKSLVEFVDLH